LTLSLNRSGRGEASGFERRGYGTHNRGQNLRELYSAAPQRQKESSPNAPGDLGSRHARPELRGVGDELRLANAKERAGRVGSAGARARLQQSGKSNAWVTPRAVATELIPATAGAAHASECSRRRPEGEASTPGQKVWELISYNGTASEVAAVTSPAPSTAPSPSRLGSVPRGRRPGHSCRCRSSPARRKAR